MRRIEWMVPAAAVLLSLAPARAASAAAPTQAPKQMSEPCEAMMAERRKMMDEMRAMDDKLDQLASRMNEATGTAKVDATAAVVNELVSQRKRMRERMESMQQRMMRHMMEHMQRGPGSAMSCPMMQRGKPPA